MKPNCSILFLKSQKSKISEFSKVIDLAQRKQCVNNKVVFFTNDNIHLRLNKISREKFQEFCYKVFGGINLR